MQEGLINGEDDKPKPTKSTQRSLTKSTMRRSPTTFDLNAFEKSKQNEEIEDVSKRLSVSSLQSSLEQESKDENPK